jgi:hypothetical protein
MVPLYMNHHVPSAITAGLRRRVLFSQDEDLLAIAHQRLQTGRDFGGVVYAHQLAISIGQAVRDLELLAKVLDPEDLRNRIEYLPYS